MGELITKSGEVYSKAHSRAANLRDRANGITTDESPSIVRSQQSNLQHEMCSRETIYRA